MRGVVAGLVVVALASACVFMFMGKGEKPQVEKAEKERGRIKEVTPAVVPTNPAPVEVVKEETPPKPKHPNFGRFPVEVDENGDRWIVRNGRRRKVIRGGPVGTSRQLWFNRAENAISALVTVKPGDTIIGFEIGPGFKEEFANSMLNKIEVTPEDTPEEAEEKMRVKEAKSNLVQALKNGEDIEQIMRDEYKNVMKMYNYRQNLVKELSELRAKGVSDQELDDYVAAANKMLEQQGIDNPVRLASKERLRKLRLERDTAK